MLADLTRIRELQALQRRALVDADGARIEELHAEREAVQARLVPLRESGLNPADRKAAEALISEIVDEQASLLAVADEIRRQVGEQISQIASGRGAIEGYRVRGGSSLYLDQSG